MTGPWEDYQAGPWEDYQVAPFQPLPSAANPPSHPPAQYGITPATGGLVTRDAAMMAGGTGGSVLGATGGPLGVVGGGALGTMAGSYAYDVLDDAARYFQGAPRKRLESGTAFEPTKRAFEEAKTDLTVSGGVMAAGPILRRVGKPLLGKIFGTKSDEAKRLTDMAHSQGIEIGPAHLSKRKWVRGSPKVLGVFPFVGGPFRTGQARVVGQLDDRAADLLNTLSPASTRYDVAKDLTEAAVRRYRKFNTVASALYKRFDDIADNLPHKDIVPTDPLKTELSEIAARGSREKIVLESGEQFKSFGPDAIGEWLDQIARTPDRITVAGARMLERELNALLKTGTKEGWDVSRLTGMKEALQNAKSNLDVSRLSPEDGQAVLDAWNRANSFFAQTGTRFETPVAKRFGRVDKNIFGKGVFKPGTINQDQIFEAVFLAKSPEAMADLRKLVGPEKFKAASRKFLDMTFDAARIEASEGALVEDMFSAAKFERMLGLGTKEGKEAFAEMIKGSGGTVRVWENFLEVAKRSTDIAIRDPSTFLTRRLSIGGSLVGGIAIGAGKVSIPTAAIIALAARQGAKFLMNPEQLRLMTRIVDDTTSDHLRRISLVRFLRLTVPHISKEAQ